MFRALHTRVFTDTYKGLLTVIRHLGSDTKYVHVQHLFDHKWHLQKDFERDKLVSLTSKLVHMTVLYVLWTREWIENGLFTWG